jgi:acetyl esterase/lipase
MSTAVRFLFIGAGFFLSVNLFAQQLPEPVESDKFTLASAISYAEVDGFDLKLDLYMPNDVVQPPLLVWVHGGAWQRGSRADVNTTALVEQGFAMASVDFRNSGDAIFPAQIHDIKAAIRFLRASASAYGYDATRIGILGRSSGGHLTALVGVSNGHAELEGQVGEHLDQSSNVQVVVSYFGASNLNSILGQSTEYGRGMRAPAIEQLLGGSVEGRTELASLASPIAHVDRADPPLLLLHGDQDPQMPINQSHELHGSYKHLGLPVHFEVVHGAAHGGDAFFDAPRTAIVSSFLREHLH